MKENHPLEGVPGFRILARIHEGLHSLAFRAVQDDGRRVVLKTTRHPGAPRETAWLRREFEIASGLNIENVIRPFAFGGRDGTAFMSMEDFDGLDLRAWLRNRQLGLRQALVAALGTAAALEGIHRAKVIHKAVEPGNILFDPASGRVRLIDFGQAGLLPQEQAELKNPRLFSWMLPYASPEQTGRMGMWLDYRTDLYSLGVVLYELFTGRAPFLFEDPLELIHAHLARLPVPPVDLNPMMGETLSELVLTLLAKNPEERYQSAWGVARDLENCLERLD
ncbi:MAG: serine/threonine-protein kinase [Pseudomonadota bacterium]